MFVGAFAIIRENVIFGTAPILRIQPEEEKILFAHINWKFSEDFLPYVGHFRLRMELKFLRHVGHNIRIAPLGLNRNSILRNDFYVAFLLRQLVWVVFIGV